MNTGENVEALRKIIDLLRKGSILLLCLHYYVYCYAAFMDWGLTHRAVEGFMTNLARTGLFGNFYISKLTALGLLAVSLIGAKGKKDDKLRLSVALRHLFIGLGLFGASHLVLRLTTSVETLAILYMAATSAGFLLVLYGGTQLTRLIKNNVQGDIFNRLQETFPQEERLLENEYSINLPTRYNLKGKLRKAWINVINPFRALLVAGTPGAGKSYFVIRHVITQHLAKCFSMFIYDFKFDDLSVIAITIS